MAEWTRFASHLDGPGFALFQRELTRFNRGRLEPSLPDARWRARCLPAESGKPAVWAGSAHSGPLPAS